MNKPTVREQCQAAGIAENTFYKRKREGKDPTAPPLRGSQLARHVSKNSPWRSGLVLKGSLHKEKK